MFGTKKKFRDQFHKSSFAQSGEDCIIDFIFSLLKISQPSYLDIGAHHPYYLSNTALLYSRGCMGVSVEPDPELFSIIKKERPKEVSLNVGVSEKSGGMAEFYIMNVPTLNTFSKSEAIRYAGYEGKNIKEVKIISLMSVSEIIKTYFNDKSPNFVSIDVEGMDMEIVKSFDLKNHRPEVFCVETLSYTEDNTEEKSYDIVSYFESNGYFVYADTYINSIFVEKDKWKKR